MERGAISRNLFEHRLQRLAQKIDALAEKDERMLEHARQVRATRLAAAEEIYRHCASFVDAVNSKMQKGAVVLDPPSYAAADFLEDSANLIQMNVRGRILQVEFQSTPELVSTEEFRVPYTLQGFVRGFNQELLDRNRMEEQLLFYTLEKPKPIWRFFDARTYRSGPFGIEYLIGLMEQLV